MAKYENWREKELGIEQLIAKYPDVSPFVIIKTDAQRRGVHFTEAALEKVDLRVHQTVHRSFAGEKSDPSDRVPFSLLLRDGTSILTRGADADKDAREPLVVDVLDGKPVIFDNGVPLE